MSRALPLSGVVFVVLVVLSMALAGATPDTDAPGSEVASFYSDEQTRQRLATFVLAVSIPFLLFFTSSLAGLRSPADSRSRTVWRRVLLGGSIVAAATVAVGVLTHLALTDGADRGVSPQGLQALNELDGHVPYAFITAFGVMLLGAAGWLLRREGIHGWLGWAALVLGVGLFVPFVAFIPLLLSGLWIIVASVALFRSALAETAEGTISEGARD
jgi:hypothetical protein